VSPFFPGGGAPQDRLQPTIAFITEIACEPLRDHDRRSTQTTGRDRGNGSQVASGAGMTVRPMRLLFLIAVGLSVLGLSCNPQQGRVAPGVDAGRMGGSIVTVR
jgi:hypothetical protein